MNMGAVAAEESADNGTDENTSIVLDDGNESDEKEQQEEEKTDTNLLDELEPVIQPLKRKIFTVDDSIDSVSSIVPVSNSSAPLVVSGTADDRVAVSAISKLTSFLTGLAISRGEGLMIKSMANDSTYQPDLRTDKWYSTVQCSTVRNNSNSRSTRH